MKKFACALACAISILMAAIGTNAADIYMRPDGTDSSNGERNTAETAVRTLHRALFVAHKKFKQGESDVRIVVAPGRHFVGDLGPAIIDEQLLQQDDSGLRTRLESQSGITISCDSPQGEPHMGHIDPCLG
jgi:hypothetical protein